MQQLKDVESHAWYVILTLSVGLGIGFNCVWCMHFVGMGALKLAVGKESGAQGEIPVEFELTLSILSAFAAWGISALGLHVVAGRKAGSRSRVDREFFIRLGFASSLIALGVVVMHYMGMVSQTGAFRMRWHGGPVIGSCAIAWVASGAGLTILMLAGKSIFTRLASAAVIAVAVSGMHYTGMAAATYYVMDTPQLLFSGARTFRVAERDVAIVDLVIDMLLYAICMHYVELERAKAKTNQIAEQRVLEAINCVTELSHSLVCVPANYFLELRAEDFNVMYEGHRKNLHFFDSMAEVEAAKQQGAAIIFYSYQCLKFGKVGPDLVQLDAMKVSLRQVARGRGASLDNTYVWIDCLSIPQVNKASLKRAVNSIYTFACVPTTMVIICPPTIHKDTHEAVDDVTVRSRLWCRVEQVSFGCTRGTEHMFLHRGQELEALPSDWMESVCCVFDAQSSCCKLKHTTFPECDRETVCHSLLALYFHLYSQKLALSKNKKEEHSESSKAWREAWALVEKHKARMFPETFLYATATGPIEKDLFSNMLLYVEKFAESDEFRLKEQVAKFTAPATVFMSSDMYCMQSSTCIM